MQITYVFDDVGIPADYRHINGSSVHTYSLISSTGKVTYVKFHWLPTLGECLTSPLLTGKVTVLSLCFIGACVCLV